MAYGNIKGIVVEIGGDTSGLQHALKQVYSTTSSLQKELRGINSLLKLDPKNTELLAQKQKVLKENISNTREKLQELKDTQQEYISQGKDLNTPQYRALQREIIQTQNELKRLQTEASVFTRIGNNLTDLSKKMQDFGGKVQEAGGKVESLGKSLSVVSAGVTALLASGVKYNADIEQTTVALETMLGSAEAANKMLDEIKSQSKISPFDTNTLIKSNRYLIAADVNAEEATQTIKNLSDAIALTGGSNDELDRMAYNLGQIKNTGKATAMDIRQFGNANIPVMKLISEATGQSLEELEKVPITYEMIANALAYASSEGGRYYQGQEKMANTLSGSVSKLKKTFQEFLGEITEGLMPIIKKLTDKLQGLTDKFKNLTPEQKDMVLKIGLIVAAAGPLLVILGKVISSVGTIIAVGGKIVGLVGSISTSIGGMSGVLAALSGPVGIVIGVCAALVAILYDLWNNSETFRASVMAMGESIANTFNEHIKPALDDLIAIISMLWNELLQPLISWLMAVLRPVFEQVFTYIGNKVTMVFQAIGEVVHGITSVFRGLIDFIAGVFSGDWERAWKGVQEIFAGIFNGLKGLVVTPLNWIIDRLNDFISSVNQIKIPDNIPGVGGIGFNIPHISRIALAKGGIVTQPTNALIGEGKSAEAVIPLDRTLTKYLAEAMREAGGVGNISINFYPQKMSEAELDNAFNYVNRRFGLQY